jgi:hypothetical protein
MSNSAGLCAAGSAKDYLKAAFQAETSNRSLLARKQVFGLSILCYNLVLQIGTGRTLAVPAFEL